MQGKVVIITGAAKGLGRHAAHTLAKAGAKIALADIDVERMRKTVNEIQTLKAEALAIPTDVRDEKEVRRMAPDALGGAGDYDHFSSHNGCPPWPVRSLRRALHSGLNGSMAGLPRTLIRDCSADSDWERWERCRQAVSGLSH